MTDQDDATSKSNSEALQLMSLVEPTIVDMSLAKHSLALADGELGHAGPPFSSVDQIPVTVLNALSGAALHEGWAGTRQEATRLIMDGEIRLRANHDLGTVSPMAGVVRPSQALMRLENAGGAGTVFATLAESGREVLRFGVYNEVVSEGLRWSDTVLAPAIARSLPKNGLRVIPLIDAGVTLGDDIHQRNVGGMFNFARSLQSVDTAILAWLLSNPQHFLNYAMAAAKLVLDSANGLEGSTLVTAISRNGVECGIRMSGTGGTWFKAPATTPIGGFFGKFGPLDAQADLGDSAIMEAYGLGGAVAHVAPELAKTMGREWSEAMVAGAAMRKLFTTKNDKISPALAGPHGVGFGLDARRVVEANLPIRIHTGIAHRDGNTGWIGVGVAEAPVECFSVAIQSAHAQSQAAGRRLAPL